MRQKRRRLLRSPPLNTPHSTPTLRSMSPSPSTPAPNLAIVTSSVFLYIRHSFIPVRVVITNDSDTPLNLNEARMQLITANNDKFPAATLDDINRRLFSTKQAKEAMSPCSPSPSTTHPSTRRSPRMTTTSVSTTTVAPHATLAGYLFYDVKDLDDPPLKGAELHVKMIQTAAGKELFAFSIPFNKALAASAKPSAKTGEPPKNP